MARPARPKRMPEADGSFRVIGKASNGDGSVYPVRKADAAGDPRVYWRATYVDYTGKTRTVSATTKTGAIEKRTLAQARQPAAPSSSFGAKTTVGELARWWLETIARHRVRASSFGRYVDRVRRIETTIGDVVALELTPTRLAGWQADLLSSGLASKTVADARVTLRQVLAAGVDFGLLAANVADRVPPPKVVTRPARALTPEDARALIASARSDRLGAAVALLFVQGWRVSEVLGLAWEDIDFDGASAVVRRAAVYVDGSGMTLGPPKTAGVRGVHFLAPGVVAALRERRSAQAVERMAAAAWPQHRYDDAPVSLVFTTRSGGIVVRQAVVNALKRAAVAAGLDPTGLSTHTGRRTVVTTLYAAEGIDLADVARHVGHASPATTAAYVRDLGTRPQRTAEAAARRLDVV